MGNDEAVTPPKSDKALSPVQEQPVAQPYPDWAAMQAYYGPGVPMPPPYFNATVAPGHLPHPYVWGPQPLMSPFATPYPAVYPHGVYPHPSTFSPSAPDVPAKSSNSKDKGLTKKFKGFDGLAVSIRNVNAEITVGDGSGQSQSEENGVEGLSDASDENNESGGKENPRKRRPEDAPTSVDSKAREKIATPKGIPVFTSAITCKPPCTLPASTQLKAVVHHDERELKRERRKQSNRESARRSRLRKQAETEELAMKVESLNAENSTLRSELKRLKEDSEKLRMENSSLLAKMKNGQDNSADQLDNEEAPSVVVENFLSRIDELRQDESSRENTDGGKLQQLLDSNHRSNAAVAG